MSEVMRALVVPSTSLALAETFKQGFAFRVGVEILGAQRP